MDIIKAIMNGCSCSKAEAKEYYDSEIDNLRSLRDSGSLRHEDFEVACSNLGLDYDFTFHFILALTA